MATSPATDYRNVPGMAGEIATEIRRRYRPRDPGLRRPGHLRGIEVYDGAGLDGVIGNILIAYHRKAGRYPDLLSPMLYSEKLNALKLLEWLPVPQSGNKLLTEWFCTPDAAPLVKVPRILWQSDVARLPANDALPAGDYYLKANLGCGRCKRIRYPLAPAARARHEADAGTWLSEPYNVALGEWWYNVFKRAVFIEEAVTARNPSAVLLYYVFRGRTGIISVDEKQMDGSDRTRVSLYDPDFNLLPNQPASVGLVEGLALSDELKARARTLAEAIGRGHEVLRIDLLPSESGDLYLNEITVCSNSGLPLSNYARDVELGEMWGPCGFLA